MIDNNDQPDIAPPGIIDRFINHSAGKRSVTDHRYSCTVISTHLVGTGNSICRTDGSGSVSGDKCVMDTLLRFRKTGQPVSLTKGGKLFLSPGQNLMGITLVPDIPDNRVFRRIKHPVQCDGQFNRPQIGSQMASCPGYMLNQKLADFITEPADFPVTQRPQIRRRLDAVQYWIMLHVILPYVYFIPA